MFMVKLSLVNVSKGIERKAGEEYLITSDRSSFHVQDIYEEVIAEVKLTILSSL